VKEKTMSWTRFVWLTSAMATLVAVPVWGQASVTSGDRKPAEVRLDIVADRLRQTLTFATLAAVAPTLSDQRLHAQRLVNWLEGSGGRHFVPQASPEGEIRGLIEDADALLPWLADRSLDDLVRGQAVFFAQNIKAFLDLAVEACLAAVNARRLDQGIDEARKAFAYLAAALGSETGPTYLGGVLALESLLPGS